MGGQGTLYQRKSNSKWYLIISLGEKDEKGHYKQKWIDLETTDKNTAKNKRTTLMAEFHKKGRVDIPSNQTFGEWLDFWLEEIKRPRSRKGDPLKPKTYDDYEYIIRFHIKPKLGNVLLRKITTEQLHLFYNAKQKECKLGFKTDKNGNRLPSDKLLSARTIQKIQMIIRSSLNKAVGLKKIPENPDAFIDRVNYKSPDAKYLDPDEIIDFLDKNKKDRWYSAFVTCFGSGMRLGELVALKWDDINFKTKKIRIDESIETVKTHTKEGKKLCLSFQTTKSDKERTVPVPRDVMVVLRYWRWRKKREKRYAGEMYTESDYVFTWDDGRLVAPEFLSKHFGQVAIKSGYIGITFHKQRHSYATMLLERGEPTRTIQENLGHATDEITQIYAHVIDKMKERAAKKIEGFTKKRATE